MATSKPAPALRAALGAAVLLCGAAEVLAVLGIAACSRKAEPTVVEPAAPKAPPAIANLPVDMRVEQRSTTSVPGSAGKLRLTIDDVTRGQVMASLADESGAGVLAPRSFAPGVGCTFIYRGTEFTLTLKSLENSLLSRDFATFVVGAGRAPALTEDVKIERLIESIASLAGATFIRNGTDHDAAEAAEHLRTKLHADEGVVRTARQFIDHIASRSSFSGQEYKIRFADGHEESTREFLNARLAEIERGS